MYHADDYLAAYDIDINRDGIQQQRQWAYPRLFDDKIKRYREAVEAVEDIQTQWFDFSGSVVKIGRLGELSPDQQQRFEATLKTFCPWKKGPFELFGTLIDAEWRIAFKMGKNYPPYSAPHTAKSSRYWLP
jgi:tRNA (mo5U34)-methyltransferase